MSVGHLQALLGSLGRLARSPLSTLMTLLVIALALALPASLRLFVTNAQAASVVSVMAGVLLLIVLARGKPVPA